ncbi:MAG: glucose-6-phosphate isomerase [Deltaproteobacteria bacterium]|nr:glucose-6-phosphate isomerase [Deltaproteobacteria bacterium]
MVTQSHILNWSNAFTGRMQGLSLESSPFAARAASLAERLQDETGRGILPFMTMPFRGALEKEIPSVLEKLAGCKHMLVLGIGGSALGARALQKAFAPGQDRPDHAGPWLWIADNVDADTVTALFDTLPPKETALVVISKSGGTIETLAQYFLARAWLQKALGEGWKKQVVMVTDEKAGFLREEADREGIASLPVPDYLGGRYSVFSAVGMLPAAFLGVNWRALLDGASSVFAPLLKDMNTLAAHPAWKLALWNRMLMDKGYSQLIFFSYIPLWSCLGSWFAQLWAESLGKEGKGSMPFPAVGVTDQHSVNQMFLDGPRDKGCLFVHCPSLDKGPAFGNDVPEKWAWLKGRRFGDLLEAEGLGTRMALAGHNVPLAEFVFAASDERSAGTFMGLLELATVLTGWLLDINPIDQPAVELGKRLANAKLGAPGYPEENTALDAFLNRKGAVDAF